MLDTTFEGSIAEAIAKVHLSKFSFVTQIPRESDFGIDFFCITYQKWQKKRDDSDREDLILLPDYPFIVQVKKFNINNKNTLCEEEDIIEDSAPFKKYLQYNTIPIFYAVVNIETFEMKIYSGEALPWFFSKYGNGKEGTEYKSLKIRLVEKRPVKDIDLIKIDSYQHGIVQFPHILTLTPNFTISASLMEQYQHQAEIDYTEEQIKNVIAKEPAIDDIEILIYFIRNQIINLARRLDSSFTFDLTHEYQKYANYAGDASIKHYEEHLRRSFIESITSIQKLIKDDKDCKINIEFMQHIMGFEKKENLKTIFNFDLQEKFQELENDYKKFIKSKKETSDRETRKTTTSEIMGFSFGGPSSSYEATGTKSDSRDKF